MKVPKLKYSKGSVAKKDETIGHDSPEVTKEDYKRFLKIFPRENVKPTLDATEVHNAYMKIKNKKFDFTDEEIKELSVYPHKRQKKAVGSMVMPPEMASDKAPVEATEATEAPVDTYDNIPEEEKAEVEASQLPDDEMQKEYFEHTLDKALPNEEDQEYLAAMLQKDSKLSDIFDDILEKAFEFSGEGKVEGPGTGTSDSIPARLSDGEFVFTRKATDQIGAENLQKTMDDAERAYDGGLMKKAMGGRIDNPLQTEKKKEAGMMYDTTAEEQLKKQMLAANRAPSLFSKG